MTALKWLLESRLCPTSRDIRMDNLLNVLYFKGTIVTPLKYVSNKIYINVFCQTIN